MADVLDNRTEVDEDFGSDVLEVEDIDFGADMAVLGEGVLYDDKSDSLFVDDEVFEALPLENGFYLVDTGKVDELGQKILRKLKPKRMKRKHKPEKITIGELKEENYGDMLQYVKNPNITDVNWNGSQLWIDDITSGRHLTDVTLSKDFVDGFAIRVSNVVSQAYNKYNPTLEAESENVRITVVHESVSTNGTAISIRKTPAIKRINFMESIKNGSYCSEETANLMSNSVKAKMNIIVCGLPGVGKTELAKFLTNYIFAKDRVITIEDTLEIHYAKINPGKDCIELKVNDNTFTYTQAIKSSLRLLPQWIFLSEARSEEVRYLIESVSTGTKCITTLHTDDVRNIPDRVLNMIGSVSEANDAIINSVYSFFDLGILIDKRDDPRTGEIKRWISQVCLFTRVAGKNECHMLIDHGQRTDVPVPEDALRRYRLAGIKNPFEYTHIKEGVSV